MLPLHLCGNDRRNFKPMLSVLDLQPLMDTFTDVDSDINTFVGKLQNPPKRDRNKFSHTETSTDITGVACRMATQSSRDAFLEVELILLYNNAPFL